MAGTVTISEERFGSVKKILFDWISDASGDADAQTTKAYNGKILAVVTDPDDTDAPTDNYDVTVTDQDGIDVLNGAGANRDTANTEQVTDESLLGVVANDRLTVNVSNAGNANAGKVYVYIR